MYKSYTLLFIFLMLFGCDKLKNEQQKELDKKEIADFIDSWHLAVAQTNAEEYFGKMDPNGYFLGTDLTENWKNSDFKKLYLPYFEKGKAWDFTSIEKNIYSNDRNDIIWFDELLNTWMGICRGSGVIENQEGKWIMKHYVLSVTVPNNTIDEVIKSKIKNDSLYLSKKGMTIKTR